MNVARKSVFALVAAVGAVMAQSGVEQVLARFAALVRRNVAEMPNYVCVQTIERRYYGAKLSRPARDCDDLSAEKKKHSYKPVLDMIDRVRLEVGTDGTQETYSWPGWNRFSPREVFSVIADGPADSGQFVSLLQQLVQGDATDFVFREEVEMDGSKLWRYTFRTPEDRSHNYVYVGGNPVATAWDGVLWVDPATARPARLTTRTSELPKESFACEITTAADYQDVEVNGHKIILPKEARQRFSSRTGDEVESIVTFSGCRQLQPDSPAQSSTPFAPPASASPGGSPPDLDLPEDLPVSIQLTSRIDSATAAEGDRFTGKVAAAVMDKQKRTVLQAGTPVTGRLRRVVFRAHPAEVVFILHVDTAEVDGREVRLHLIGTGQPRKVDWLLDLLMGGGTGAGGGSGAGGGGLSGLRIERHPPPNGEMDVLRFKGSRKILESGYWTEWLTRQPTGDPSEAW